jgi:taurine dioxygenase
MAAIDIRPIAGALGAEILGVDLARDLRAETVAAIRKAWLDHCVVFFRDQSLTPEQFLALARAFGDPVEYPFVKGLEGFPHITPVIKLEHEKVNFGGLWHSDTAYLDKPPMGTMLIARETPARGGDTLFANMYLAYETLSAGLRRVLDGLMAINSSAKADVTKTREDRVRDNAKADAKKEYVSEHPVVRTHPETGRKAIFLGDHAQEIEGMDYDEGRALIEELNVLITPKEAVYTHVWSPRECMVWDNRCTLHRATGFDEANHVRVMRRCTINGDRPF